jgi:phosphoheptose isomerase
MGFGPPEGDGEILDALFAAHKRGAMTFDMPGYGGSYPFHSPVQNPFVHQELMEILYHTLWETVHVFFEHRELSADVGDAEFLYPFLGQQRQQTGEIVNEVAGSIRDKVQEDSNLRMRVAREESARIVQTARAMGERVAQGGKLIIFGNGGSATDANDWAIDCVRPPAGYHPIPAISLSMEPASLTAIANDVGIEVIFLRQLIAHARKEDVAIGISTSGGSRNIMMALNEARKQGLLTVALLGYDGGEILRHAAIMRQFVQRGGNSAARRIAHPVNARTHRYGQRLYQRQHGARIGTQIRLQIQLAARQQNGDAVVADRAGEQDLVAVPHRRRRDTQPRYQLTDAGGRDVHTVCLAVLDDLGIAACDDHARRARRIRHGAHFSFEDFCRQAGFEHVTYDQRLRSGARNRKVVHRAIHGQFADRATGKTQRAHDEAVGGDRHTRSVHVHVRGIPERNGNGSEKQRCE